MAVLYIFYVPFSNITTITYYSNSDSGVHCASINSSNKTNVGAILGSGYIVNLQVSGMRESNSLRADPNQSWRW